MIPDLVIGGRPVSRAEIDAAPALRPEDYLAVADAPGRPTRDLHAERDSFAELLMSHGMPAEQAVARARRTAEHHDRTSRRR